VSDIALQASQAIAVLAASDYIDDSFVAGDGSTYSRVTYDNDKGTAAIFQASHPFTVGDGIGIAMYLDGRVSLLDKSEPGKPVIISTANPLIYKSSTNNTDGFEQYIIQVEGNVVRLQFKIVDGGHSSKIVGDPISINSDEYTAFAERNNITVNTKLGATILLKTLLMDEGYSSTELDETFIDIQPDYIAFIEKTLTPGLDSELTAVSSGIKAAIDFLKKIIQKASQ
jgi:hypothetical protein